jgi:hypothetical protein
MYRSESPSQLTAGTVRQALVRLGDLLARKNLRLELVCCGGVVSVLYHGSRQMTHDVDVLFPDNPKMVSVLTQLVDQVGEEMRLAHGPKDRWLNDGISFFGLQTRSDVVIFRHPNLVLKAADWHEMLAHKLTAFRGDRDISDAKRFLQEIPNTDMDAVHRKVAQYRPFVPTVADTEFERRFVLVWKLVHGQPK